ncbi:MAG: ATP-binding domain-containing protein, partial [Candidatus Omnitrophica bacterium]|nr:ATP-binding domain-containing protein [Candidatus Omnitrophota bacterium]
VDIAAGEDPLNPHLILTPTNRLAGGINERRLAELDAKECAYYATITGEFPWDAYPTAYHLKLKKGAQVMLIKNDRDKRWVNGTLAVIEEVTLDCVKVLIDGEVYEVLQDKWEQFEHTYNKERGETEKEVVGTFTQYPIKLAWAVTIHKSQGHTFDDIIIDLGNGAFSHGQVYVALSRCRTLEGISLAKPIRHKDIIFDKRVCRFTDKFVRSEIGIKS